MKHKIRQSKGVRGTFTVPGDKSISHRALLIGSLSEGVTEIVGLSNAEDPKRTLECLHHLGCEIDVKGAKTQVKGKGLRGFRASEKNLDAGNSGTTMRLLTGILAGQQFYSEISGDRYLQRRPMKRIIEPLSLMGAHVEGTPEFTAPLRIRPVQNLHPIEYELPIPSAQVKSAILLAGLYADGVTSVIESVNTRDHTERMLGLRVREMAGRRISSVEGGLRIDARRFFVPGDISAAAFLIAAALIVPDSEIVLRDIGLNPTRSAVLELFRSIGGNLEVLGLREMCGEPLGTIVAKSSDLHGKIDLSGAIVAMLIDEIPIIAVTAAFSEGSFRLRDASELRHKESDRIRTMVLNLRALGIDVEEYDDGFAFMGKKDLIPALIKCNADHRIAMAFGIAGLGIRGELEIEDSEYADVSYPAYWQILKGFQ